MGGESVQIKHSDFLHLKMTGPGSKSTAELVKDSLGYEMIEFIRENSSRWSSTEKNHSVDTSTENSRICSSWTEYFCKSVETLIALAWNAAVSN
jgi:hypothetical protein